ncbi:hypothetical protein XENTR_v10002238 [Xenopus tropicalis]|nr:hypothetical protein XENTR_v10002238 [Xenopus tropicalis]
MVRRTARSAWNIRNGCWQERALISDTLRAEAMARRKTVFQVNQASGMVANGSNGGTCSADRTRLRSHGGRGSRKGGQMRDTP